LRAAVLTVAVVVVVLIGALFAVQNSARTVQLSLDLGFVAWQLAEPMPVPLLVGLSFGSGLLIGAGVISIKAMQLAARARRLEQQVGIQSFASGGAKRDPGSW
jgi:uncharacterized integral membrane protein